MSGRWIVSEFPSRADEVASGLVPRAEQRESWPDFVAAMRQGTSRAGR